MWLKSPLRFDKILLIEGTFYTNLTDVFNFNPNYMT